MDTASVSDLISEVSVSDIPYSAGSESIGTFSVKSHEIRQRPRRVKCQICYGYTSAPMELHQQSRGCLAARHLRSLEDSISQTRELINIINKLKILDERSPDGR